MRARVARWTAPSPPVRKGGTLPQPRHPGTSLGAVALALLAVGGPKAGGLDGVAGQAASLGSGDSAPVKAEAMAAPTDRVFMCTGRQDFERGGLH